MAEFLLELYSEEIPPELQINSRKELKDSLEKSLKEESLNFKSISSYSSPTRLTILIKDIPKKIKVKAKDIKGPKVGVLEDILNNFMRAHNVNKKDVFESSLKIDVYQSIIKNSKLELIIEKLVELGISSFTPVIAERSQKKDIISLSENKINRLKKISIESAEQSGKFFIPEIRSKERFVDLFKERKLNNSIIFYESIDGAIGLNKINFDSYNNSTMSIFIGPVGGFSKNEINLSKNSGAKIVNIGETVLKSDTAAIVSCALIRYLIENNLS